MSIEPRKVLKTGISAVTMIDPLKVIEDDISQFEYVPIEGVPDFTGMLPIHIKIFGMTN